MIGQCWGPRLEGPQRRREGRIQQRMDRGDLGRKAARDQRGYLRSHRSEIEPRSLCSQAVCGRPTRGVACRPTSGRSDSLCDVERAAFACNPPSLPCTRRLALQTVLVRVITVVWPGRVYIVIQATQSDTHVTLAGQQVRCSTKRTNPTATKLTRSES